MKTLEHPPDVRVVIDADHHLPLAAPHEVGHTLVVLEGEIHPIALGLPVRRVHVEKGVRPVIPLGTVQPGQILDVDAGQALPGGREVLFDPQQVDGRRRRGRAERLPGHLATEGMVLQVEEARSALDVSQGFGPGHLLPLKDLAAGKGPFELAHELLEVVLHHPVEAHQVAVNVVQHLGRRRHRAEEEERSAAGKHLDVALMGREQRDKTVGQAALAAHPGNDRIGHIVQAFTV